MSNTSPQQSRLWEAQSSLVNRQELPSVTLIGAGHLGSMTAASLAMMGVGSGADGTSRTSTPDSTEMRSSTTRATGRQRQTDGFSVEEYVQTASRTSTGMASGQPAQPARNSGMVLYDNDRVEPRNIPASFFTVAQAGLPKVTALCENITAFTGARPTAFNAKFHDNQVQTEVCVVSVDSREERIVLFELIANSPAVKLFIDLRSGLSLVHIYAFRLPEEVELYPATLAHEGIDVPCSARAVAYNSFTVAGLAGGIVAAYTAKRVFPQHIVIDHHSWAMIVEMP